MKKKAIAILFSLLIALILVVGCAGDPMAEIYTESLFPTS